MRRLLKHVKRISPDGVELLIEVGNSLNLLEDEEEEMPRRTKKMKEAETDTDAVEAGTLKNLEALRRAMGTDDDSLIEAEPTPEAPKQKPAPAAGTDNPDELPSLRRLKAGWNKQD